MRTSENFQWERSGAVDVYRSLQFIKIYSWHIFTQLKSTWNFSEQNARRDQLATIVTIYTTTTTTVAHFINANKHSMSANIKHHHSFNWCSGQALRDPFSEFNGRSLQFNAQSTMILFYRSWIRIYTSIWHMCVRKKRTEFVQNTLCYMQYVIRMPFGCVLMWTRRNEFKMHIRHTHTQCFQIGTEVKWKSYTLIRFRSFFFYFTILNSIGKWLEGSIPNLWILTHQATPMCAALKHNSSELCIQYLIKNEIYHH